ncbi:hypothetical protein [Paenibacillus contaminans]|uniref:Uncharacterized protein n=1 Tax=Paenibacillus contaminans TaxID=450362 RepID=A0A329MRR4_9BACL|nr:hypothetical protein [Paenibacillus contaminans]RAV22661.1 hypothetical protein DQG23_00120 [Paenibacillus contaminans]
MNELETLLFVIISTSVFMIGVFFVDILGWVQDLIIKRRRNKLKKQWEKAYMELGNALLPVMIELTKTLNSVTEEMRNFTMEDEYEDLSEEELLELERMHFPSRSDEQEKEDDNLGIK